MNEIEVGPFTYRRRDYTPKRRGATAGHGWIRDHNGRRAEVGMEIKMLVDEIERLREGIVRIGIDLASDGPPIIVGVDPTTGGLHIIEHSCPACRVERTDYEGPLKYLPTCPNCGSIDAPVPTTSLDALS